MPLNDPHHCTLLVTGGAGFVGSSIALHWKERHPKARVIAFDNLKRRGSELNLSRLKEAGIEFVHGDVRVKEDLLQLPTIDALVECSAEPSVLAGYGSGAGYVVDTNLLGTVNCLELVVRDRADLVFLSTSRVYPISRINEHCEEVEGRFQFRPDASCPGLSGHGIAEEFPLAGARSLYGATKLASELLITEYVAMHGIRAVIDRCGVIAGPWQMGRTDQGYVLLWLARHHWGIPLSYIGFGGKGAQVRDVLHVDDLCDLVALQLRSMDKAIGQVYNVGGGLSNSGSLADMTALAREVTGNTIELGSDPTERSGDIKAYVTDARLIARETGWRPQRDLRTIFLDSYRWLKANEDQLRPILT